MSVAGDGPAATPASVGGGNGHGPRLVAPLVLLGLAGIVLVEPLLASDSWLRRTLGPDVGLRFAVVGLCVYVALLILERRHTGQLLRAILEELRRLRPAVAAGRVGASTEGSVGRGVDHRAAVDILVKALESDDAQVRANAHTHLVRLTDMDLGEDPAAWRRALAEHRADD